MTNSDHHFAIGKSHTVCEDYAASQPQFTALSDGCSCVIDENGKKVDAHTDIGSRLLVRAAFHHQSILDESEFYTAATHTADGYRRQLGMGLGTLSATLMTLRTVGTINHYFHVTACGDGVIALRHRDGSGWFVQCIEFDGPPDYPRYRLSDRSRVVSYPVRWFGHKSLADDSKILHLSQRYSWFSEICCTKDYDLAVCMSDGAFSFTKDSNPVEFNVEFANRLLDFRRMAGRFVLRHLTGVLRELAEDGIVNQDDISMIAMYNAEE